MLTEWSGLTSDRFLGAVFAPGADVPRINGKGNEVGALEEAVVAKGAEVAGRFFCRGRFLFLVREHPTGNDLEDARRFAREVAEG